MSRHVWIDGTRVELRTLLAQGGEAEVYDLGDGRVVKWWKPADHPDFAGNAVAQAAAAKRIAEGGARLRALPARLPGSVVAPIGLALSRKREVIGYVMPKIAGEPLFSLGEPRWRRAQTGIDVPAVLLALHDALAALHRAGVVVGDCNDLNVLVDHQRSRVHLIDVDSYQLPGFPCSMFSERFVDPRLCDAGQLVPVRPHDEASDWFAFAAMALRSLVFVGPWGGVARGLSTTARASQRKSVLATDVTYPRTARPLATLPDGLLHLFRAIFERDERGMFPRSALEQLRFVVCASCGEEHARLRCPACAKPVPAVAVHGRLRWQPIAMPATSPSAVFVDGDGLWRTTALGPERIGSVLAGGTRVWAGDSFGIGFYRAGGYARGFVFHPARGGLNDSVAMPRLRGQLVAAHATLGADRAYLWLTLAEAGRLATTAIVVDTCARVLACEVLDAAWAGGVAGACAAGSHLFVPTDDGIVRVEIVGGALVQTRSFPETSLLVTASDRLVFHTGGLAVIRARDAISLQLT